MSSSMHIDNNGKDILILGKGPTQGPDDTALTAETQHSSNFTRINIKFVQACIIMEATVYYLLMLQKYISSK